jgi:hypothetical protein
MNRVQLIQANENIFETYFGLGTELGAICSYYIHSYLPRGARSKILSDHLDCLLLPSGLDPFRSRKWSKTKKEVLRWSLSVVVVVGVKNERSRSALHAITVLISEPNRDFLSIT